MPRTHTRSPRRIPKRLLVSYRNDPTVRLPGWVIYEDTSIKTPIAILPEPIGGVKNRQGRSPYQEAYAHLLIHAANTHHRLLSATRQAHRATRTLAGSLPKQQQKLAHDLRTIAANLASAIKLARRNG